MDKYKKILDLLSDILNEKNNLPYQLLKQLSHRFGYDKTIFLPCMAETIYHETQTKWAAFNNLICVNIPLEIMQDYSIRYFKSDIFSPANLPAKLRKKRSLQISDIMSYEKYEQTEYYRFVSDLGYYYQAALALQGEDGRGLAYIGIFRTRNEGPFTKEDMELMELISEYVSPLLIRFIKSSTAVFLYPMLDLLLNGTEFGAVVTDNRRMVLWFNQEAEKISRLYNTESDIVMLKPQYFMNESTVQIQRMIGTLDAVLLGQSDDHYTSSLQPAFTFWIHPFMVHNVTGNVESRKLIIIHHAGRADVSAPETLSSRLTAKERVILEGVCIGKSNRELAEHLGISPYTIRTHISNIYKKFGVHNKSELLLLMKDSDIPR
jgi:DNA-binding CsgD family transcriptional regulator